MRYNRDTVELYLRHFYDHWVGRKESVRPAEFDAIVDHFARPGAVRSNFAWYRTRSSGHRPKPEADPEKTIACPAFVLWGEADPVFPAEWSDRLGEHFPDLDRRLLPGVGHFVPFEAPEEALGAIRNALRPAGAGPG